MKKIFTILTLIVSLFIFGQESFKFPFTNINNLDKKDLKDVKLKVDEFKGTAFITPKGFMSETYRIEPYLSYKNDSVTFRIKFKYYSKSWLFHKKVMIKVNDEIKEFDVNPSEDVIKGGIQEISDIVLNIDDINFLRKVADSKKDIIIRYEGEKHEDQKLYSMERNYLKKIINFFDKYKK